MATKTKAVLIVIMTYVRGSITAEEINKAKTELNAIDVRLVTIPFKGNAAFPKFESHGTLVDMVTGFAEPVKTFEQRMRETH